MGVDYFCCSGNNCNEILNDCSCNYVNCGNCEESYCYGCIDDNIKKFGKVKINKDNYTCQTCFKCNEDEKKTIEKEKKEKNIYLELKECNRCKYKTKFKRTCINKECKK